MAVKKQSGNSGNTQNSSLMKTVLISFVILAAALGIGMVIRELRTGSPVDESIAQIEEESTYIPEQEEVPEVINTITENIYYPEPEPEEEIVYEPEPEPVEETPEEEPVYSNDEDYYNTQRMQDLMQWRSWLSTLTDEERMQLLRGSIVSFLQLLERWQYMPPEQVNAEREQLEQMFTGWQDLSPEERQMGIENIQYQLEEWLSYNQQY